ADKFFVITDEDRKDLFANLRETCESARYFRQQVNDLKIPELEMHFGLISNLTKCIERPETVDSFITADLTWGDYLKQRDSFLTARKILGVWTNSKILL